MKSKILSMLVIIGIFAIYEIVRKIWIRIAREKLPETNDITKWLFGMVCGMLLTCIILVIFRGWKFWFSSQNPPPK